MKKLGLMAIALMMIVCLAAGATAESTVTERTVQVYGMELNPYTNTFAVQETRNSYYVLMDAEGNALTDRPFIKMDTQYEYFLVAETTELNNRGMIDGQGNIVVPMEYGDIDYISTDWLAAKKVVVSTAENYDIRYYGNETIYTLIDTVDLYYRGEKAGTLSRMEYKYATAFGAYLRIQSRDDKVTYYDSKLNARAGEGVYGEYSYDYKTKTVTHNATGIAAFTAGCPLTEDEVLQSLYEVNGKMLDLQGNVVYENQWYSLYLDDETGYARVRTATRLYGLVDRQGNVIINCDYDEVDYDITLPVTGYQYVEKDGKGGFVNAAGEVTCAFTYSKDVIHQDGVFAYVKDLSGEYILLTAAAGEIKEHFSDLSIYRSNGSLLLPVETTDGQAGVISVTGEMIIAPRAEYDYYGDLTVSRDGTLVLGNQGYNKGSYTYVIYQVDLDTTVAAVDETPAPATEGWTCVACGTTNTGKFCAECGAAAPAPATEEAKVDWICPGCGNVNTGKFCPECGTAKPEESKNWICPSCGAENEGKFCPNDGTAKP